MHYKCFTLLLFIKIAVSSLYFVNIRLLDFLRINEQQRSCKITSLKDDVHFM